MSLISDALRKARREATERGDHRKHLVVPATVIERPGRARSGLLPAAVIAVAAALVGAAAAWWLLAGGVDPEPGTTPRDRAPEAAAPLSGPAPSVGGENLGEPEGAATAGGSRRVVEEKASSDAVAPSISSVPGSPVEDPQPEVGTGPVAGGRPLPGETTQRPRARAGGSGERVFVIDAELGDLHLSLDYIIYRPSDPFAQINGVEVHIGDAVAGFTVEEITRDHVLLRDADGPLELRVR